MECNKEEAVRAKDIAENKMLVKDYIAAKKIALKAQQLFPELENISQLLAVCEVHCCANNKVNGEIDWYSILQVEQTADDASIKKQYRKLALSLHPDKNKFAGAEAAFKLIGEAHMTLSDKAKRAVYDLKRRATNRPAISRPPAQKQNTTSFVRKQPSVQASFANTTTFHFGGGINQQQQSSASNSPTFWTMCPNCCMKFQYFRTLVNRNLRCHRCLTNYTASELTEQAVPRSWESSAPINQTQNLKQEVPVGKSFGGMGSKTNGAEGSKSRSGVNVVHGNGGSTTKQKDDGKPERVNIQKAGKSQKRGRKAVVESSSESESSTDVEDTVIEEDVCPPEQNSGPSTGRYPRRSSRHKQNVTYKEGGSDDDDFVSPPKRLRKVGSVPVKDHDGQSKENSSEESSPDPGKAANSKMHETKQAPSVKEEVFKARSESNATSAAHSKVRSFSTPDPEFYDFEKERDLSKFKAGQIWAVYDNFDAMPRFYARIVEVHVPFRLRFTWLEHYSMSEFEHKWISKDLPVACGTFRHGKTTWTKDLQMFSHLIFFKKGTKGNTYDIHPKKGEVWAIFKDWSVGWCSDADNKRLYEYEIIEVISDDGDFEVTDLVKVEGFVSLFVKSKVKRSSPIPRDESLRFSHMIPYYRMAEGERKGVPEGSFELDTASLPINFAESFPSINLNSASVKPEKLDDLDSASVKPEKLDDLDCASVNKPGKLDDINDNSTRENGNVDSGFCSSHPLDPPSPPSYEIPQTDFHDFQEDRSIEKFYKGQIWALYSDVDQFPKFYAKIKKVDVEDISITVSWIELCTQGKKDELMWVENDLPAACGRFKVNRETEPPFVTTDTFSHLVNAVQCGRRGDQYDIYPKSGEVWAIYKDWNVNWTRSDLTKCQYDVVEILSCVGSVIKVLMLTKVDPYTTVFMPEMKGGNEHMVEIPISENLRFSHQIPAFRLTDEADGALYGYWELDSASIPKDLM